MHESLSKPNQISGKGSTTHQQLLKILTGEPAGAATGSMGHASFSTESDVDRELSHSTNAEPFATQGTPDGAVLLLANGIFTRMDVTPKSEYSEQMSNLFQASGPMIGLLKAGTWMPMESNKAERGASWIYCLPSL